ncbi:MAG: SpoIIE family protein phosphatase [Chloroflexi bacterium]|nr:SpoIIE family protein phosphatase [Chloroflexota bacterium]
MEISPNTTPLKREDLITLLHELPLFSELPRGELKYLAYTLNHVTLDADTIIFRENEVGESFYIVVSGDVDVIMGIDTPDEKLLATLGPGEYSGEMSLVIPGGKRSASIRTRSKSQLLVMTREDFDELLNRQPNVAYAMVKVISNRLRNSDNAAFHELREKNHQLQTAYDELKAAHAQVIEKEKLEKELQLAAEIQISILPRVLPVVPGVDFGGHMDPARSVGGDLYDVFQIDTDRIGVLIGDVADKGVPSAIFMARAHALLTAESLRGAGPGEVLRSVNTYLTRLDQGDLFVTVTYGIYDLRSAVFHYARAGHELPLLVSAAGEVLELARKESLPIGLFSEIPLDEQSINIPAGGTLLLFTDGMCDCRNSQGEEFGRERIAAGLSALSARSAQETCDGLIRSLLDFRELAAQDDDVTLVTLHRA